MSGTVDVLEQFPIGASVGIYAEDGRFPLDGTPQGSVLATATVAANGSLTIPLADGDYQLHAVVNGAHVWKRAQTSALSSSVVNASGAANGLVPIASGSNGYLWGPSASGALIAQPWQANQTYSTGQLVSQAGQLYTAKANFTAGASFNAANWNLGVQNGAQIYEENSSGQVIAIWSGNGSGNAATLILDVLTAGVFNPRGVWSNLTAYSTNDVVSRSGGSYIAVAASTGIDPATEAPSGIHWLQLASQGATGPQGPAGSATADGAVTERNLETLARASMNGWLMGNGFAQNYRRDDAGAVVTTSTRQLLSAGGLILPGGRAVAALRMVATTVIGTPLHQFVAFYDARTLALLASGTDVTTQAMTLSTDVSFPIVYTPANSIEVLAVYYCEATTTPAFAGKGSVAAGALTPRLGGLHDTLIAGSGPAALPLTLGAATSGKGPFWVQAE